MLDNKIVKKFMYQGFKCVIIKMDLIGININFDKYRQKEFLENIYPYHNGYVKVSNVKGIKVEGNYDSFADKYLDNTCPELTFMSTLDYNGLSKDELYIGFDTAHLYDNKVTKSVESVEKEIKKIVDCLICLAGKRCIE